MCNEILQAHHQRGSKDIYKLIFIFVIIFFIFKNQNQFQKVFALIKNEEAITLKRITDIILFSYNIIKKANL